MTVAWIQISFHPEKTNFKSPKFEAKETHGMHDTAIVEIILFNNVRRSTIDQTSKCRAGSKLQVSIDQFTFPIGRTHLHREFGHSNNGWMLATSDSTAQCIQEEILRLLDDVFGDICISEVGSPASQTLSPRASGQF
jgi:hypothetical protein